MNSSYVRRYQRDVGSVVRTDVEDRRGGVVLSFPGRDIMDMYGLAGPAGRTVLLAGTLPLCAATALVGLPAFTAIDHAIFAAGTSNGSAIITAIAAVAGTACVTFDREIDVRVDEIVRLPEGRLRLRYVSPLEVHLLAPAGNDVDADGPN